MISLDSIRTIAFHISNLDEISDISEAILYNELLFIDYERYINWSAE